MGPITVDPSIIPDINIISGEHAFYVPNIDDYFGPVKANNGSLFTFGGSYMNDRIWALKSTDNGVSWAVVPNQTGLNPIWADVHAEFVYPNFYFMSRTANFAGFTFKTFNVDTETWAAGPFADFFPVSFNQPHFYLIDSANYFFIYATTNDVSFYYTGGPRRLVMVDSGTYAVRAVIDSHKTAHIFITKQASGVQTVFYTRVLYGGTNGLVINPPSTFLTQEVGTLAVWQLIGEPVYNLSTDEIIFVALLNTEVINEHKLVLYRGTPSSDPVWTSEEIARGTFNGTQIRNPQIVGNQNGDYTNPKILFSAGEDGDTGYPTHLYVAQKSLNVWSSSILLDTISNPPDIPDGWSWEGFDYIYGFQYPDGSWGFIQGGEAYDELGNFPCEFLIYWGNSGTTTPPGGGNGGGGNGGGGGNPGEGEGGNPPVQSQYCQTIKEHDDTSPMENGVPEVIFKVGGE